MTIQFAIIFTILLIFTIYMGLQDGANSIATPIATNAVSKNEAMLIAIIFNFIAPVLAYLSMNLSVSNTISNDLLFKDKISTFGSKIGFHFVLASLLSACFWLIFTSILHIPSSSSHSLLGSVIGAAVPFFSITSLQWMNIFTKVILVAILTPFICMILAYIFMQFIKIIASRLRSGIIKYVMILQRVNIAILSSAISINDVQKSMGIMFLLILVAPGYNISNSFDFSSIYFVIILCFAFCFGLFFGAKKMIYTIGSNIYKLTKFDSFVSQLSSEIIAMTSSLIGLPISTGQIVSSSIIGLGAAQNKYMVRWNVSKKIVVNWLITLPCTFILSMLLAYIFRGIIS